MIDKSKGSTARILLGLVGFVLPMIFAAPSSAQTAPNGRWEFVVTSGDTQYQLNQVGQVTFSTYLSLAGTVLSGDSQETTGTSAGEIFCCNDIVTGAFTKQGGGHNCSGGVFRAGKCFYRTGGV